MSLTEGVLAGTPAPSGILLVDKPEGWTSHDVVARTRRLAATRKVGHAGTLDPMATGLLILGIQSSTRLLTYIVGYGPILCAVTVDSYIKEWRGAARTWDKTEKTGRVLG